MNQSMAAQEYARYLHYKRGYSEDEAIECAQACVIANLIVRDPNVSEDDEDEPAMEGIEDFFENIPEDPESIASGLVQLIDDCCGAALKYMAIAGGVAIGLALMILLIKGIGKEANINKFLKNRTAIVETYNSQVSAIIHDYDDKAAKKLIKQAARILPGAAALNNAYRTGKRYRKLAKYNIRTASDLDQLVSDMKTIVRGVEKLAIYLNDREPANKSTIHRICSSLNYSNYNAMKTDMDSIVKMTRKK